MFADVGNGSDPMTMSDFTTMPHHPEAWHQKFKPSRGELGRINCVFSDNHVMSLPCTRVVGTTYKFKEQSDDVTTWVDAWSKTRWRTNGA